MARTGRYIFQPTAWCMAALAAVLLAPQPMALAEGPDLPGEAPMGATVYGKDGVELGRVVDVVPGMDNVPRYLIIRLDGTGPADIVQVPRYRFAALDGLSLYAPITRDQLAAEPDPATFAPEQAWIGGPGSPE